jgi:hypothetical protein
MLGALFLLLIIIVLKSIWVYRNFFFPYTRHLLLSIVNQWVTRYSCF